MAHLWGERRAKHQSIHHPSQLTVIAHVRHRQYHQAEPSTTAAPAPLPHHHRIPPPGPERAGVPGLHDQGARAAGRGAHGGVRHRAIRHGQSPVKNAGRRELQRADDATAQQTHNDSQTRPLLYALDDAEFSNLSDYDFVVQFVFRDVADLKRMKADARFLEKLAPDHVRFADMSKTT